ncbi:hypothetical protein HHI36_004158 [Cryptolaemus montrouzieri]|uniref:WH2 domain-containing protein n=1 Tax=Cryptolaemus montrouzieri TaxID=559131 RepID=A0ABD2NRD1_9CUCU
MRISSAMSDNSAASDIGIKNENNLTICHSRHSSDSSGYHETSILSDQCNTSLPRRNKSDEKEMRGKSLNRHSDSTGNLTKMMVQSRSTSSLAFPGRKKKAAPPPPRPTSSIVSLEKPSPVVASQTLVSASPSRTESVTSGTHQSTQIKPQSDNLEISSELPTVNGNFEKSAGIENANRKATENEYSSIQISSRASEMNRYNIEYENSPQDSGNSSDISEKSKLDEEIPDIQPNESEEWQLPSPPKAFKDSTPSGQNEQTEMTVTDTVITPELLEKLKNIEQEQDIQKEETNVHSDNSSTISEDRLVLSKLSLENLEKRKSLVYNRELATSLKLSYETNTQQAATPSNRYQSDLNLSKSLTQFEKTLEDIRNSNQREEENSRKIKAAATQSTLPNFKITTYNEPKQKIQVFEDDTIRSNTGKSVTLDRAQSLQKNNFGRSMENISAKNPSEDIFRKPREAGRRMFRPKSDNFRRPINRSGSFSTEQNDWSPSKPVARSKSQVAIKRNETGVNLSHPDNLYKSNSLFDVSGLQSLEVMRKIQNKLNTPTTSMETLTKLESEKTEEPRPQQETQSRKFHYSGPPSVNMATWSERPKVSVNVKEDIDYRMGPRTNKVTIQDSQKEEVELRRPTDSKSYNYPDKTENQNVTIKVNGSEPISTQRNGNVLIKIGEQNNRYQEFNSDTLYRQPFNNLSRNSPRPHSVAFPSDFDMSRVPVVRSVELKKTFKPATSVTHLNQTNGNYFSNGFSQNPKYSTIENLTNNKYVNENISKPVFRAKSFLQSAPVVKGFRNFENNTVKDNNVINKTNRHSWQPNSSMTLPATPKQETYTTNQNVPFSKFNLRKTDSKKIMENENNGNEKGKFQFSKRNEYVPQLVDDDKLEETPAPPQPPKMPNIVQKKISNRQYVPVLDPRDELLKSIRDFGGKKGLRGRKA